MPLLSSRSLIRIKNLRTLFELAYQKLRLVVFNFQNQKSKVLPNNSYHYPELDYVPKLNYKQKSVKCHLKIVEARSSNNIKHCHPVEVKFLWQI